MQVQFCACYAYLIFCCGYQFESMVTSMIEQFELNGGWPKFTEALLQNDSIQTLGISLTFQENQVC